MRDGKGEPRLCDRGLRRHATRPKDGSLVVRYRDGKPMSFSAAKTLTLKVGERSLIESRLLRDVEDNF